MLAVAISNWLVSGMRRGRSVPILDDHADPVRDRPIPRDVRGHQLDLGLDLELLQPERRLGAIRCAELDARVRQVTRDRVRAEGETLGDGTVGQAMRRQLEHFYLAFRHPGSEPPL